MQNLREEKGPGTLLFSTVLQFKKFGHFSFLNCPNFVTIFCQFLKMETIFLISLAFPRPSRSGIH